MNEKELEKSLNKDVKPGTEQIALNTAQTQANQLLTEQSMNLQAERQVMTSNSERDVELRGAVELGAMNAAQPQQVQQVSLPPQAAGLRPETQELLAKYGVNPTITESARTTSNSSQTKAANSKMQVVPNQATGGDTRVTNTTNITNITNNNSKVETNVDMPKQPAILPQAQPARLAPIAAGAGAGMAVMAANNKFKTFLDNLFAKRDHERQLQEREFRRRDWSIQRMSRKVMERMNSISEKFASKMNPEKVGSTFMSQIKLFLSMVGLTLLPKVWPAIIKGIDGISGFLSDIKTAWTSEDGGFMKKLGAVGSTIAEKVVSGVMSVGGTIVGSLEGIATKIADRLTDVLAGADYDEAEKKAKGLIGILGDKLVNFFGGNHKEITFPQMLKSYFSTLAKDIKNIFDVMAEDRATAIKSVWERDKDKGILKGGSLTSITRLLNNLPALLAAAIGGHRGLQNNSMYNAQQKSKEELFSGGMEDGTHYSKFTGRIKNSEGAKFMATNLANVHSNENSNSVLHAEGIKKLYEFSKRTNNSISIDKVALEKIINKVSKSEDDKKRLTEEIDHAIDKKLITAVSEQGISTKFVTSTKTDKVIEPTGRITYTITKDAVPTFLSLLSGQSDGVTFKLNDGEELSDLMEKNKAHLENLIYDNYKNYVINIDKQFMNKDWVTKSSLNNYGYLDAMETADQYSEQLDKAFGKFVDDTGVEWFYDEKIKKWIPSIGPTREQLNTFHLNRDVARAYTYNNAENLPKIAYNTIKDKVTDVANGLTGAAGKAGNAISNAVNYVANESEIGAVAANNVAAGQTNSPLTNGTNTASNTGWGNWGYTSGNQESNANPSVQLPSPDTSGGSGKAYDIPRLEDGSIDYIKWAQMEGAGYMQVDSQEKAKAWIENKIQENNKVESDLLLLDNPNTSIEKRRDIIIKWAQKNLGLNEEQAIGITAVMECESNLDPKALNQENVRKGAKYPDSGLCQWQGVDRVENGFLKWYDEIGSKYYGPRKSTDMHAMQFPAAIQLDYLRYELETGRRNLLSKLQSASGFSEAADLFFRGYENGSADLRSGGKIASAEAINRDFSKTEWAKRLPSSVTPHMHMSKGRQEKALGIYALRKGGEIPKDDLNYLASINMSGARANLSGAIKFSNQDMLAQNVQSINDVQSTSNTLASGLSNVFEFLDSLLFGESEDEVAQSIPSSTDSSDTSTSMTMSSMTNAKLSVTQPTMSIPEAKIEHSEVVPQFTPKTEIAKALEVDSSNKDKTEENQVAPSTTYQDNSSHMADNSSVVNNYNIVSDHALQSFTVHGRNLGSNHT